MRRTDVQRAFSPIPYRKSVAELPVYLDMGAEMLPGILNQEEVKWNEETRLSDSGENSVY